MNALEQVTLTAGRHTLKGFSISGVATYVQVPDLDVVFDLGECPLSAVPINHVFLTHAHGDHSRCVLRHAALRGMFNMPEPATYYLPDAITDDFVALARAEARFEGVAEDAFLPPKLVRLAGDRTLVPFKRNLFVSAFPVKHRVPSLGYTIIERRQKLKAEYGALAGAEIAKLKTSGVEVSQASDVPLLTFIGDCVGLSLLEEDHIWKSDVVIIEATFLADGDEAMAKQKGHTHLREIGEALTQLGDRVLTQHIVLKHFSMKHQRPEIEDAVKRHVPAEFLPRVQLLL